MESSYRKVAHQLLLEGNGLGGSEMLAETRDQMRPLIFSR